MSITNYVKLDGSIERQEFIDDDLMPTISECWVYENAPSTDETMSYDALCDDEGESLLLHQKEERYSDF
jgi:hypothetical protein